MRPMVILKVCPLPFQKDHIRFGIAVVIGISFSFQLFKQGVLGKWVWLICALFLIGYLHLLASKTALLALYIIILYEVIALIVKRKKKVIRFWFAVKLDCIARVVLLYKFYFL